ncbi:MAG: hypothetical protein P8N72_08880 [Flavimaricola sp.]|nr:hypothetical protein [Flavimaricola sp.]
MTRWLQAAKQSTEGHMHPAFAAGHAARKPTEERVLSVVSVLSQGESPGRVPRDTTPPKPEPANVPTPEAFPYGTACNMGDATRTWTGRIVSLNEWRRLTEWEKHGPNGRHWNGITKQWEQPP